MNPLVVLATAAIAMAVCLIAEPNFSRKLKSGGFVSQDLSLIHI